ncbi:uncharacterized protein LOC129004282 [Macrosteles quadrilineatus]|uniref:uncharacterized protein LOC129004282 n=1 Tax=Macrosteles quadrilineatus TaxID=74068 RepID=UPI0023E09ED9|nr:uncharacterized protein LOC129004282 [Macrosteles quadrilineatus]
MGTAEQVQELKEQGNQCLKDGKSMEAVLHYTHAIKLDPKNYSLYSNRSLAFLKAQQYYYALQDAKETIRLKPDWAKGYFRKGEVESATYNYTDAILSYSLALRLLPEDQTLAAALERTTRERSRDLRADAQTPWLGAGVGLILGVMIVIADHVVAEKPTLSHPVLMALITIAIAMVGYCIARGCRYYMSCQKQGLLDPPVDLFPDEEQETEDSETSNGSARTSGNHQRYTKAQARLRFKKGKKS